MNDRRRCWPVSEGRPTAMDGQHMRACVVADVPIVSGMSFGRDRPGRGDGTRRDMAGNRFPSGPRERDRAFMITFTGTL